MMEEEDISVKEDVIDKAMSNGDSSVMEEDILSRIDQDMLSTFMPIKDTMEPIFMPGIEKTEQIKDGVSKILEMEII